MTSTLSVIGLVIRSRSSNNTTYGDAEYREKIYNKNHVFSFKQFSNARHEYNEAFKEGDLVLFAGKFTIDKQKLFLIVEMACILEPKIGRDGEILKWDPAEIPSTKPFINIATTPSETLSTHGDMNFIKTRSLIYSAFHQTARYINFDVGYSNESKWLEFAKDKWNSFANFFIAGFLEDIYLNEKESESYAQVNATLIDYDVRFRNQNNSSQPSSKSTSVTTNAFSQRRDSFKTKESQLNSSPDNSSSTPNISSPTKPHTYNKRKDINTRSSLVIENESENELENEPEPTTPKYSYKKRGTARTPPAIEIASEDEPEDEPQNEPEATTPKRSYRKRGTARTPPAIEIASEDEPEDEPQNEPEAEPKLTTPKRSYRKRGIAEPEDEPITPRQRYNKRGGRGTSNATPRSKKRQLSDLCNEIINEPTEQEPTEQKPKRSYNRRGRGGKR